MIKSVKLRLENKLIESELSPQAKSLWKERKHLSVIRGKLMHSRLCSDQKQWQLVLPRTYHKVALEYVHNRMGLGSYWEKGFTGLACKNQLSTTLPSVIDAYDRKTIILHMLHLSIHKFLSQWSWCVSTF